MPVAPSVPPTEENAMPRVAVPRGVGISEGPGGVPPTCTRRALGGFDRPCEWPLLPELDPLMAPTPQDDSETTPALPLGRISAGEDTRRSPEAGEPVPRGQSMPAESEKSIAAPCDGPVRLSEGPPTPPVCRVGDVSTSPGAEARRLSEPAEAGRWRPSLLDCTSKDMRGSTGGGGAQALLPTYLPQRPADGRKQQQRIVECSALGDLYGRVPEEGPRVSVAAAIQQESHEARWLGVRRVARAPPSARQMQRCLSQRVGRIDGDAAGEEEVQSASLSSASSSMNRSIARRRSGSAKVRAVLQHHAQSMGIPRSSGGARLLRSPGRRGHVCSEVLGRKRCTA